MLKPGLTGLLTAIERWASQSNERERLLITLISVGIGVSVLVAILIAGWIWLPPDSSPF